MKPLVSVIVPVYNVENYLRKSVDSIRNQTLTNIEIILIDDGSTDASGEICDELALVDERIRVIHKENGGVSEARNVGVQQARADFIGFVDADDYIDEMMYERLYDEIIQEEADLAYCNFYHVDGNHMRSDYSYESGKVVLERLNLVNNLLTSNNISVHLWTKLYKKEIAIKHKFPVGKTHEDAAFLIPYVLDCKKAVGIMEPMYYYIKRNGSMVNRDYSPEDLDFIDVHEKNFELLKDTSVFLMGAKYRLYWSRFYVLDKMLISAEFKDFDTRRKVVKYLRKHFFDIIKNPYVKKGRKLAMLALMFHEKFYELALRRKKN